MSEQFETRLGMPEFVHAASGVRLSHEHLDRRNPAVRPESPDPQPPAGARRARGGGRAQGGQYAARADRSAAVSCSPRWRHWRLLVLGPEAPLLALGSGLGILAMSLIPRDAPQQALALIAAAGSFAALASIFGSPVIGAVLMIEAAGLGGAMLAVVLLPGLMASGIGARVHRVWGRGPVSVLPRGH
jgi:hypothetical protein